MRNTTPNLYLDLEETIIDNWYNGILINVQSIKCYLDDVYDKNIPIHIWSYAIGNQRDQREFLDTGMKSIIETALGRKIINFPSIEEMMSTVSAYEGLRYDSIPEFMQINGKHWSFIKYCLAQHSGANCVLIDDTIGNWTFKCNDTNTSVELVNVRTLILC